MKHPQKRSKTKRKSAVALLGTISEDTLEQMAQDARYRPSPYHKSNPAAWGLSRSVPRPDKTVCEGAGIVSCRDAAEFVQSEWERRGQ